MDGKKIERYILSISSPEDPLLAELDRETHLRAVQPRMISGHVQGRFLELVTRMIRPRNVLEIGTFTGYSTLCFAAGLDDGAVIDTIEIDDELDSLAAAFFARSPHGDKIRRHTGSALDVAPRLGRVFDLVFIDGDKREYPDYYRMLMGDLGNAPMVAGGSWIVADNVLWYGKAAEEVVPPNDVYTRCIREFNEMVRLDPRVENVVLAMRDGLSLIRVK